MITMTYQPGLTVYRKLRSMKCTNIHILKKYPVPPPSQTFFSFYWHTTYSNTIIYTYILYIYAYSNTCFKKPIIKQSPWSKEFHGNPATHRRCWAVLLWASPADCRPEVPRPAQRGVWSSSGAQLMGFFEGKTHRNLVNFRGNIIVLLMTN